MMNSDKISFILGKESSEYLKILILGYAYPSANDFWDGNWLNVRISIRTRGFSGDYKAELRNVDFLEFQKELDNLYNKLNGFAEFHCLEDYLRIMIKGDGMGHFTADCTATDSPGIYGHLLKFSINFDQTEISYLTRMIDLIIDKYPIKEIQQL